MIITYMLFSLIAIEDKLYSYKMLLHVSNEEENLLYWKILRKIALCEIKALMSRNKLWLGIWLKEFRKDFYQWWLQLDSNPEQLSS